MQLPMMYGRMWKLIDYESNPEFAFDSELEQPKASYRMNLIGPDKSVIAVAKISIEAAPEMMCLAIDQILGNKMTPSVPALPESGTEKEEEIEDKDVEDDDGD